MHSVLLFGAKYLYLLVPLLAAAYWLTLPKRQKIQLLVFGIVTAVVTFALVKVGAALFYDPRPFVSHNVQPLYPHAPDNGFPSDHTWFTAFIAIAVYSMSKRLGSALFVIAILVGSARVAGHIHSPIDILGSLVFSIAGGIVAYYLTPKLLAAFAKSSQSKHSS
jgi:undecaprenyl-diphosphatase